LTIAGSDSSGGAGIQADLKTFAALGVYGTSVITSVTAQNTLGVHGIHELPPDFVGLQIDSVVKDIGVDAVKTGMLANADIVAVVAAKVREYALPNLVVDPLILAKGGERLLREDALHTLVNLLIPLAEVVTPNIYEAEVLSGFHIEDLGDLKKAAEAIYKLGARYVVIKGGHFRGEKSVDFLFDGENFAEFSSTRIEKGNAHGLGCTFASAIAAELAKGRNVADAVKSAKEYITSLLNYPLRIGRGYNLLDHLHSTLNLPNITQSSSNLPPSPIILKRSIVSRR